MTENKRFTNIEHDYENAWIKCNDNGDFMIYAIYKELDESLPSLEDLLNGLHEENKEFKVTIGEMEDYLARMEEKNKELKKETNELKQQFIVLLKKLGKKNVQCSFCEHGEHYSELVDGYYEPRFICHKKGQEYTQRSFCEDWKIKVKE